MKLLDVRLDTLPIGGSAWLVMTLNAIFKGDTAEAAAYARLAARAGTTALDSRASMQGAA